MHRAVCLALASCFACAPAARGGDGEQVVEVYPFLSERAEGARFQAWGMDGRPGSGPDIGWVLLNGDHQARPWAGVAFQPPAGRPAPPTMTTEWLAAGHVRLQVRAGADDYGQEVWPGELQLRVMGAMDGYERIPRRFYAPPAPAEAARRVALVPLRFLGVQPGAKVTGLNLQCVERPQSSFAVGDVALVRLARPLARDADRAKADVAQPRVTWPGYEELPDSLKLPRNEPLLRDGRFVTSDGRRTFLMTPWSREDQRLVLGHNADGKLCPNYGLYDPNSQAFVYEQPLVERSLSRLGFNAYSGSVDPVPFWRALGYDRPHHGRFGEEDFRRHVAAMGYPFYVDFVCFPWTLGRPAEDKSWKAPPGLLHNGSHHWTPYRILGRGREAWLTMWRLYARRYKDAGAKVIFYELFNEPAYAATTDDHRDEFAEWLRRRYGTLGKVNEAWGTTYASWEAIRNFRNVRECTGIFFDYDEYLGDCFAELVRAAQQALGEITPGVPAAVQAMGGYCLQPRQAVFLDKLIPHQLAVLTPTGGGDWTQGIANDRPRDRAIESGIAPSPLANDLLLAMAGGKMIVDNETYLGAGQTRRQMRSRLWRNVLVGLDGCAWFSWSKRGWAWWEGRERILHEADRYPYSNLIPFARRADAIPGVLDFARQMELVREFILPKPWGPKPNVALLYSWANARWRCWRPEDRDKTGHYHAAMRYQHWDFDVLPSHLAGSERLKQYELIVAGGIDHVEPELPDRLLRWVRAGGRLIVADGPMDRDPYDKPLDPSPLLGFRPGGRGRLPVGDLEVVVPPREPLYVDVVSGAAGLRAVPEAEGVAVVLRDGKQRPVVVRRGLGQGAAYYLAADLRGYGLAKLLAELYRRAGLEAPALSITDAEAGGGLAPNVLVSRRSYETHQALLLRNMDPFGKRVRICIDRLTGDWHVSDPLSGTSYPPPGGAAWRGEQLGSHGVELALDVDDTALLLLTRKPWTKTKLRPARPPT